MPIDLSNLAASAPSATPTFSPKWFHDDLTGNGKGMGLVNAHLTPVSQAKPPQLGIWPNTRSKIEIDADHTVRIIPVGIIPTMLTNAIWAMDIGRDLFAIDSLDPDWQVALGLTPQTALIHYKRDAAGNASRQLSCRYRVELYVYPAGQQLDEGASIEAVRLTASPWRLGQAPQQGVSSAAVLYAETNVRAAIDELLDYCPIKMDLDLKALDHWLDDYCLFDQLSELARMWSDPATGSLLSDHINALMIGHPSAAGETARYLENYNLPLDAYGVINDNLVGASLDQDMVRHQNLNLLMYATLNNLVAIKSQLPTTPVCTQPKPGRASDEQWAATTSAEPLTLVAAGAGSGKTTVIMARIAYLQSLGIELDKVTVLSFTNAAAQNVLDRNPGVKSLTIARMILDIYEANHPTHQVSEIATICNSLRIFPDQANPDLDLTFARVLRAVGASAISKDRASAPMVDLSTFVSDNIDWVLGRLDTIRQTCLELTMIVSYLTRDTSVIPPETLTEYLIVDEVQDTSLYEFAYLMTFARLQQANLFMVGDPSQTLYEFRGTDPRALMILANNDDFVNFALNTNYRSNQQILDFANVQLGGLDTNKGLDIQLCSNQLSQGTEASFLDTVRLRTVYERTEQEFVKDLANLTDSVVRPYVEECLEKGEQVAIVAPTRRMGTIMENRLTTLFPNARVDNITSARRVSNQIFSRFISDQWSDVVAAGPSSASMAVVKLIGANVARYGPRWGDEAAKAKSLTEFLSEWWLDQSAVINAMVAHTLAGVATEDQFFERLRDLMLQYEIKINAAAQAALQLRNNLRKQMPGKPDIVISTIHGVKGLEFDNVVVVNNEKDNFAQDKKRMAYVALTRAKKTELVLAYRTTKDSLLRDTHDALAKLYWRQDVLEEARNNGVPIDSMTEDELLDLLGDAEKARETVSTEVA